MIQFWDWTNITEGKEQGINTSSTDSGVCKNMKKYLGSIQFNCTEASPRSPTSACWELKCISGQTPKTFYSLVWAQSCNSFLLRILTNRQLALDSPFHCRMSNHTCRLNVCRERKMKLKWEHAEEPHRWNGDCLKHICPDATLPLCAKDSSFTTKLHSIEETSAFPLWEK